MRAGKLMNRPFRLFRYTNIAETTPTCFLSLLFRAGKYPNPFSRLVPLPLVDYKNTYTHTQTYIYIRLEKEVTRERQIKSKHVCDQLTKHSVLMSILKFCNVYDKEFHRVFTGYYSKRILFDYSLSLLRVKEKKRIPLSRIFHIRML